MSEQSDSGWRSIPLDEPVEVKAGEPTWFETDGHTARAVADPEPPD